MKLASRQNILIFILVVIAGYALIVFLGRGNDVTVLEDTDTLTKTPSMINLSRGELSVFSDPRFVLLKGTVISAPSVQTLGRSTLSEDIMPPQDLQVIDMKVGGKVFLLWKKPDDATVQSFTIYRSLISPELGTAIARGVKGESFVDVDLVDGQQYQYTVVSLGAAATESVRFARASIVPTDQEFPAAPTNLEVEDTDEGTVAVSWESSVDEDVVGYELYRSEIRGDVGLLIASVEPDDDHYVDSDVEQEIEYFYSVVAVDEAGNRSPIQLTTVSGRDNPFEPYTP
ncbi:MAG: hypothetical protein HYZ08_01055 [Candidatus Kerfeldbacteria bacterium]|nr:hypothetical protein [Candidatus Kerfeldbacteria bacterium]